MKDRLTPGFIAGVLGSILQRVYFWVVAFFGISDKSYTDYGKIIIMYKPFKGVLAFVIGFIFVLIIGGLLGIVVSYVIKNTSSRFYILKAVLVGISAWLILLTPGTFFRMPMFTVVPPLDSLFMLIGSIIWGLSAAWFLKKLTTNFRSYFTD